MDGEPAIRFADAEILRILTTEKAYCNYDPTTGDIGQLALIDRDGDKMITHEEVALVSLICNRPDFNLSIFANNTKIKTFNEFQYFTGLSTSTSCFSGCTALQEVTLPPLKALGDSFFNSSGIRKVVIPEGYLSVGRNLASYCNDCYLIDLPTTITSIGESMLWKVKDKVTIVCRAIAPPTIGGLGYEGIPVAIYVPDASVPAYRAATNWTTFSSKIHPLSEYVES